jgi:2-dehydro-3-deoxygluconokinase
MSEVLSPGGVPSGAVLCLGEAMVSLRSQGRLRLGSPLTMSVAGAESNVAIGLARLGHPVAFAGGVGADETGELVVRTLRAEGVATDHLRRDPDRPTGVLFRERRTSELVHVEYVRRGSAGSALDEALIAAALADGSALLHVSGVTAALSPDALRTVAAALRLARRAGVLTSLDVNYRGRLWSREDAAAALSPMLPDVDLLFASGDELPLVFGDGGVQFGPGRPPEVVVTHGADGAEAITAGEHVRCPARPVVAIDVVGAGDAFVAGYLSARLDGLGLPGRLARGTAVAAVAVGTDGDWEGLPTRAELATFAAAHDGTLR